MNVHIKIYSHATIIPYILNNTIYTFTNILLINLAQAKKSYDLRMEDWREIYFRN